MVGSGTLVLSGRLQLISPSLGCDFRSGER
jgi:hypothetical protein